MSIVRSRHRDIFFAVMIVAVICGGVVWLHKLYYFMHYTQVRTVSSALADHPEIEKVWVCTNEDVELEIEKLYFSIADEPGVILKINGIDAASKSEIQQKLERAIRQQPSVDLPTYAEPWRWAAWK
jgi:hypothetical protein